ncbi:MAG: hypothetical protein RBS37_12590 [Bacteroidales bacterium]|jgi:hypothetical protein|nr:hypothetical protein [Bacteroidales bacterium]
MRIAAFFSLVFCALGLQAQQEILIKSMYHPEKVYLTSALMTMKGEINLEGDEDIMEQIAQSGTTFPVKLDGLNEVELTLSTSARDADGTLPATMTYDKMKISMQMNGMEQGGDSPFTGMEIKGRYDVEGSFMVESAKGLGEEFSQEDMSNTINKLQQFVGFPDKPLKVGDTFTMKVPLDIPVSSMSGLSVYTESDYTVREINPTSVLLDIVIRLAMDSGQEVMGAAATGTGTGTCVYDRAETIITSYEFDMDYSIKMDVQRIMTMTFKMISHTKQSTRVK